MIISKQIQARFVVAVALAALCAGPAGAAKVGNQSASDYGSDGDLTSCGSIGGVTIDCSTGPFFGGGVFFNDTFFTFIGSADTLAVPLFFANGVPDTLPSFVTCNDFNPTAADACFTVQTLNGLTGPPPDGFIVGTPDDIPSTTLTDLRTLGADFTATGADTGILTLTNLPGQATIGFDSVPVTLDSTTPEPGSFVLLGSSLLIALFSTAYRSRAKGTGARS